MVFRGCRWLVLEPVSLKARGTQAKIFRTIDSENLPHRMYPWIVFRDEFYPILHVIRDHGMYARNSILCRLHGSDHLGSPLSCYLHNYPSEG